MTAGMLAWDSVRKLDDAVRQGAQQGNQLGLTVAGHDGVHMAIMCRTGQGHLQLLLKPTILLPKSMPHVFYHQARLTGRLLWHLPRHQTRHVRKWPCTWAGVTEACHLSGERGWGNRCAQLRKGSDFFFNPIILCKGMQEEQS